MDLQTPIIAPSILAADFTRLDQAAEVIENSEADWYHIDVMDGMFVPNISFGMPVMKSLNAIRNKPFDVHLMIVDPDRYIADFKKAGADILTVHFEACNHLHRTVQSIHQHEMKAGVALNPHTRVECLEDILGDIDLVCMMSVNPGFGGQKFIERTYDKVRRLRAMAQKVNPNLHIEIDGGVTEENAGALLLAGADVLVAGSTVFRSTDPVQTITNLKAAG